MVAHDSRRTPDPLRALSPASIAELRVAVVAELSASDTPSDELREAVRRAAAEARERGARPEELIAVLRLVEAEIASAAPDLPPEERESLGARIATALLRAYFAR